MAKNAVAIPDFGKKCTAEIITESLDKHGEIKGKTKKETKNLRLICNHHRYTKKRRVKPNISNDGAGRCDCPMCNGSFTTHQFTNEELKERIGLVLEILSQARFMTAAAGLGREMERYYAMTSVHVGHLAKAYKKTRNALAKAERTKSGKGKRDKKKNRATSHAYGSWSN